MSPALYPPGTPRVQEASAGHGEGRVPAPEAQGVPAEHHRLGCLLRGKPVSVAGPTRLPVGPGPAHGRRPVFLPAVDPRPPTGI